MEGRKQDSLIVGITGGIACGKSEVGRILDQRGFEVLDSDEVARELVEPQGEAYDRIVEHFGRNILQNDGRIDRASLADKVFQDVSARGDLNRIVHPPVLRRCRKWVMRKREEGVRGAVIIPLLFEVGEIRNWDAILCVSAPRDAVIARLEKRGLKRRQALDRICAQMALAEKEKKSDYVIYNDGDIQKLKSSTEQFINQITKKEE